MISDEKVQKAVDYLEWSDKPHAMSKAEFDNLHELRKTILAYAFDATAGGVEERKNAALRSDEYVEHMNKVKDAQIEYQTMQNRRQTAYCLIDLWRTYQANTRKGNI